VAAVAEYPNVKLLHPEVPNFVTEEEMKWPPEGASTDGELSQDWPTGDPKGFNLMIENSADVSELANYIVDSLASRNSWTDPDKWFGQLAWRVEITDDHKEYTFYLRQGVKWHPVSAVNLASQKYAWLNLAHEVTAHDFVFALDMTLNPQVQNGFTKSYYQDVESYRAVDDYTLVVRWKTKTYQSLSATLGLNPLPKFLYAFDESGQEYPKETLGLRLNQHWYNNKGIVGTGPYRFEAYQPGVKITLVRNEEYFGQKPALKRLTYPIYTDTKQTVLKLKSGEINFGELKPGQYREEVLIWKDKPVASRPQNNPFVNGKLECVVQDYPAYSYLGWNADKPLFSDAKVRTAMTLALNRELLIQEVFVGLGTVATGPWLPQTGQLDPSIDPLEFDLDRAKKLLSEAGWSDTDGDGLLDKVLGGQKTPFEFTLLIYGNRPEYTSLGNIFKEDLLKIGVKLNIEAADWSLMQKRMDEKKFDAFTGGWATGWDNDPYQLWHSSQADIPKGSNRVGFRNPEADTLIEELRSTFDPEKRTTMLRRLHRLIYDAQAYSFLRVVQMPYCWAKEVKNVTFAKVRPIEDSKPWWVSSAN
jgi:ABC-type transport system substrate-binding protein